MRDSDNWGWPENMQIKLRNNAMKSADPTPLSHIADDQSDVPARQFNTS
jgi:hypothetical protein